MRTLLCKASAITFCAVLPLLQLATAQSPPPEHLKVLLEGLTPSGDLPLSSAFCMPPGSNTVPIDRSPGIRWTGAPAGTQSFVLLMVDVDVPKDLSLINRPGLVIPATTPRMNIYHWILVDIPKETRRLAPGAEGESFFPAGKPIGKTNEGVRGTNDYWPLFNKNPHAPPGRQGAYGGYDGPCPPMNDEKVHTYEFKVFALDIKTLNLSGQFFAPAVLSAMQGHVLAEGEADAKFSFDRQ